jgi:hypothetical protein
LRSTAARPLKTPARSEGNPPFGVARVGSGGRYTYRDTQPQNGVGMARPVKTCPGCGRPSWGGFHCETCTRELGLVVDPRPKAVASKKNQTDLGHMILGIVGIVAMIALVVWIAASWADDASPPSTAPAAVMPKRAAPVPPAPQPQEPYSQACWDFADAVAAWQTSAARYAMDDLRTILESAESEPNLKLRRIARAMMRTAAGRSKDAFAHQVGRFAVACTPYLAKYFPNYPEGLVQ